MHKTLVAVVVAVAACVGAPAAADVGPPPPAPSHRSEGATEHRYTGSGRTVAIIGDSLTLGSWDQLYRDLSADHRVKIAAYVGEAFDGGRYSDVTGTYVIGKVVDEYAAHPPDVVVIALGSNTVWSGGGAHHDDLGLALRREAAAIARFRGSCRVWVTLPTDPGAKGWRPTWAQRLNRAATWADQTANWGTPGGAPGPVLVDGGRVHSTPSGYEARAAVIAAAVRACR